MKRILLYHGKHGDEAWDASTPELHEHAMSSLFKYLDEEWGFYTDLVEMQSSLYVKAKGGDAKAAERVLSMRKGYEYERWELLGIQE